MKHLLIFSKNFSKNIDFGNENIIAAIAIIIVRTQVVIDNKKKIVHVESGFRGHNNDANTFDMMTPIGDGRTLDFPRNCVLLGDCIYPSRHPVVTPFTSAQLRRLPRHERNIRRKINKNIRTYRVYVEHVIRLLKVFKIIGSLPRHASLVLIHEDRDYHVLTYTKYMLSTI